MMKWLAYVVAIVLILAGAVFALQGLRLLPSQVMYGRAEWIVIGAVMVIVGIALAAYTRSRGRRAVTN
jgi:hypothetical protein